VGLHLRFHFHFTPTSASWLDAAEGISQTLQTAAQALASSTLPSGHQPETFT
jgi:hypothetical protein